MYEGLMSTSQPLVFPMNAGDVDLDSELKTASSSLTCIRCQKNVAEIFQESGEFCLPCWQERTYPNL
jgi:hypothetical protein